MKAVKLIQHFNRINGNQLTLATAKDLHAQVTKELDHNSHGPCTTALKEVQSKLAKFMKMCTAQNLTRYDRIEFEPVQYHPGMGLKELIQVGRKELGKVESKNPKPVKPKVEKPKAIKPKVESAKLKVAKVESEKKTNLVKADSKPATSNQKQETKKSSGVNYTYHPIDLGEYQKDFHRMYSDTIVQVHGLPGHGKTVYELKLAHYLSKKYNVLYVAREEYGRSVFDMKLKEHGISESKNLRFKRKLDKADIQWANVIFLDSVNALKLTHEDVEDLSIDYPNRNWHLVMQSTKDGSFRGSMEWEHLVDIAGEIHNRKLILRKNRLDPNNSSKMSKLLKADAIAEAKKKAEIREAVKASTKKEVEPNKQAA